jgi:hypothetical protein
VRSKHLSKCTLPFAKTGLGADFKWAVTICQDRLEAVVTRRFVLSLAGRTLLVLDQDEWWFTDGAVCPSRSWSCHFKALSSCSADADDLGAFVCCSPDKTINLLQLSR